MTRIADLLGPVPPLDDEARRRIAATVLDRPAPATSEVQPSRRWRLAVAVGFAAVAAATVVLVWMNGSHAPSREAQAGRHEAHDAAVEVTWAGARIVVEPGGSIVTEGNAGQGAIVTVERGAASFVVEPRGDRPPFAVVVQDVRVEVVGTRFRVASGPQPSVRVDEGIVRVIADGTEALVEAAGAWPTSEASVATPAPREPEGAAIASPPPARPPVEVAAPKKEEPAGAPSKPTRTRKVEKPTKASAREQYERAARLEASDRAAAAAIYRELSGRSDSWGAIALYALARLEALDGRRAPARKLLRDYLRRFPDGINADDVRALLEDLR